MSLFKLKNNSAKGPREVLADARQALSEIQDERVANF